MQQGLWEPKFYGDLVHKFKKIVGKTEFSDQFKKIIMRYKCIGYNVAVMRHFACLVVNPFTVNNFAVLFNCTPVGRGTDPNIKLNIWLVGARHLSVSWPIEVQLVVFFCSSVSVVLLTPMGSPSVPARCNCRDLIFASSQSFQ